MDIKTISVALVAVMVGAVMFGALIPIFADVTATEDTFTNEGAFDVMYSQEDDVILAWDHTAPTKIKVNDSEIDLPVLTNGQQRTILCGDGWLIRVGYGTTLGGYFVQWYPTSGNNILASVANGYDLTVTCEDGTVTVTDSQSPAVTATSTYTYIYCISDDGEYVMKNPDDAVYMNGDSEFYAMGLTNVGTYSSTGIKITGTIDDGATWSIFRGNPDNFSFSDQEINYTEVSGYENLYKLDSLTATVTANDDDVPAVYSYFIVPAEITAERSIHVDGSLGTVMDLIPLIIGMGLVLLTVGWFISKKF